MFIDTSKKFGRFELIKFKNKKAEVSITSACKALYRKFIV